jgi:hypothetical protein
MGLDLKNKFNPNSKKHKNEKYIEWPNNQES